MKKIIVRTAVSFVICFFCLGAASANGSELIRIGAVEDVVLLPWSVKLPGRVDTGAAITSLDARDISVKKQIVEFKIPSEYGGQKIQLQLLRWMTVKSAGTRSKRPVVLLDLCIGSKQFRAQVNLNDRSNVKYPLLIGRNILERSFLVDISSSNFTKPSCTTDDYPKLIAAP